MLDKTLIFRSKTLNIQRTTLKNQSFGMENRGFAQPNDKFLQNLKFLATAPMAHLKLLLLHFSNAANK